MQPPLHSLRHQEQQPQERSLLPAPSVRPSHTLPSLWNEQALTQAQERQQKPTQRKCEDTAMYWRPQGHTLQTSAPCSALLVFRLSNSFPLLQISANCMRHAACHVLVGNTSVETGMQKRRGVHLLLSPRNLSSCPKISRGYSLY